MSASSFFSKHSLLAALAALVTACSNGVDPSDPSYAVPTHFPVMPYPADNAPTAERITLGERLFFDTRLSRTGTISCASCHHPNVAFADTLAISPGVEGRLGTRNAPSLLNVGYQPYFLREGGVPTLEMQALVPIQEHAEFDENILTIAERLRGDQEISHLSVSAYGRDVDPYVITRALAAFERTLVSGDAPYDRFVKGNTASMSAAAQRGMRLFFGSRTNCSSCHGGFLFTTHGFENNGLYTEYADPGRFRLTGVESDRAVFKIPSLRHVSVTPPYMHDGSVRTLRAVLEHYNSGGSPHRNKSTLIRPLGLTSSELLDLEKFLECL
jgi:cytochrome c peroxidase